MKTGINNKAIILGLFSLAMIFGLALHASAANTNEGTDFWVAWPFTWYSEAEVVVQSDTSANVTLSGAASWTGTVSAGTPGIIPLPVSARITSDDIVETKGIHVASDAEVSVLFRTPEGSGIHADDIYLALPTEGLGTEYYSLTYKGQHGPSWYLIIATEDGTSVTYEKYDWSVVTKTMNIGQTLQIQSVGDTDITGRHITSDKPIVVLSGTKCSDIPPSGGACDTLLAEMLPVDIWGMDYYTAPLMEGDYYRWGITHPVGDYIRIMASEDSTVVTVNDGMTITSYTLALAGDWIELDIDPATHILSDKPIQVAQFGKGITEVGIGDPFQMQIIPAGRYLDEYRFYTPPGYDQGDYVSIIAPISGTQVYLDGVAVTSDWTALPDGGEYTIVSVGTGEHTVTATNPVGVYAHGYRWCGTYGYPAGLLITTLIPAEIDVDPDTLNLKSQGKWITAYIGLPIGYSVEDIDIETVKLWYGGNSVSAAWGDVQDSILMVKFDREAVQSLLSPAEEVELTVIGELTDGTPFGGSDTIRVIEKGNGNGGNSGSAGKGKK